MRKQTCGQCSATDNLVSSTWPVRTKTGRVKIINSDLCGDCRRQAQAIIGRALHQGRLAV